MVPESTGGSTGEPTREPTTDGDAKRDGEEPRRFQFDPGRRRDLTSPRYSRFVGMMKLLLPLMALGLVVAVVIWPNEFREATGFHLSYDTPDDGSAAELTMLHPRYLGTDARNRPFVVTADRATQDPKDQRNVTLLQLQADMATADGRWFTIMADKGVYHQQRQQLRLQGPINLFSDQGYEFTAQIADIDLKAGRAVSDQPVRGQGPFGTLQADRMEVDDFGQRLLFMGNVKMRVMAPARGGRG
ncbi:MAG: LPS export ABC transporter periplasmic protein LptC [Rhodospirillaceae bacterium]|nr:LPS export ABC transporter periplasmic protein LptC [Rhodospirillaceae bacterium]MBT4689711.1 LPS export ABC transporter periplasmic protein LptC [Rhodospirillaceae bacterium]MBT5080515.1 LPS export ABC transporter periplasmic protein LptC [Rhodospirillaceae bacterium]MBT5523157.1 LPS export ABC transporter periplasmic protein LptC [Rhodospirillaceae bacterium]MBT5879278.1 LPS export ABC transporter periplasmic protein LptC [Rhodospirillaceae bacterium]